MTWKRRRQGIQNDARDNRIVEGPDGQACPCNEPVARRPVLLRRRQSLDVQAARGVQTARATSDHQDVASSTLGLPSPIFVSLVSRRP